MPVYALAIVCHLQVTMNGIIVVSEAHPITHPLNLRY
jgi:hypothetical protein